MLWMGYFFASFLHTQVSMVPGLILDVAIGTAWVLLLSCTVLRTNPRRTLKHVRLSVGARARSLAAAGAALLRCNPDDEHAVNKAKRKLRSRQTAVGEAALVVEAWSADDSALPQGWSAQALRRRILDLQIALDAMAGATEALAGGDRTLKRVAARVLAAVADRDYATAGRAARLLQRRAERARKEDSPGWWPALHLAAAAEEFLDVAQTVGSPPEVGDEPDFAPAVSLAMGNLPGSPAIARNVPVRGSRRNPLTRLDFTTRQAVQVALAGALAIVFGRELDQSRYYWAVIAAFIAFTGTGTRSETFIKASNRVLGTLTGLVAGIGFAHLTAGHTGWVLGVIVASMFLGFYLIRLSYAYMIFFVTIMVSQLYSVLGQFSDQLLVLRLEETVVGAACGIAVALLVAPLSTRDTVASSQSDLLEALADVLNGVADRVGGIDPASIADLDEAQRVLDNRLRELLQVSAPLTRPLLRDNSPRRARHDLALYILLVAASRHVAVSLRSPRTPPAQLATAARALAAAARRLACDPPAPGRREQTTTGAIDEPLAGAEAALFAASGEDGASAADWSSPVATARRALIRLHAVLREIAIGSGDEPIPARPVARPAAATG
jgi:uncharacterized membrane protein YccC